METSKFITQDGASFSVAHVLSFESEKAFIGKYIGQSVPWKDVKVRKANLKSIYKQAKASE